MSVSRRLAAHRQAVASAQAGAPLPNTDPIAPDDDDKIPTPSKSKDKENEDMTEELEKAKAKGQAEGFKASNDRMNAVLKSEHYVGRENAAHAMLGNAKFEASDIINVLAVSPKIEPMAIADFTGMIGISAETDDELSASAEAAARAEMTAAIKGNVNSAIVTGGGDVAVDDAAQVRATSKNVWAKAYGLNEKGNK